MDHKILYFPGINEEDIQEDIQEDIDTEDLQREFEGVLMPTNIVPSITSDDLILCLKNLTDLLSNLEVPLEIKQKIEQQIFTLQSYAITFLPSRLQGSQYKYILTEE